MNINRARIETMLAKRGMTQAALASIWTFPAEHQHHFDAGHVCA